MRVLVTGALGYVGGRLCESLRALGHAVIASARSVPPPAQAWAEQFELRLADVLRDDLGELVRDVEAIVHLASLDEREAERSPGEALLVSGEGTRRLLEAAARAHVRRTIFFSTFHVYGPSAPPRIDEHTATYAAHPYAIAHQAGEGFCLQAAQRGQSTVCVRLSNGYGAPSWADVDRWSLAHNDFCRQAVRHDKIVLRSPGTQQRDFVALGDVAAAVSILLGADIDPRLPIYNVGGNCSLSIYELAVRVAERARILRGADCPIERPEPHASSTTPVDFRIDRMQNLGYRPTDQIDPETSRLFRLLEGSGA